MDGRASQFRLDNPVPAFRFTATLIDSFGVAVERLVTPTSPATWFELNGFGPRPVNSPKATWCARELREVIHRIGTATATDGESDPADVDRLNEFSVAGAGHLTLEHGRATWCLSSRSWVDSLFGVIADDAVRVLGGESRTRVRACARPECRGLYVDTSRAGTRRGRSMNYCGNRQKKQNLRASTR